MALHRYQQIFDGTIPGGGFFASLLYLRSPFAGTITRIDIWTASNVSGDAIFNIKLDGVAQFAGAARPKILSGTKTVAKTGLSIAVTRGQVLTLDLEQNPLVSPPRPVVLEYEIDDGIAAGSSNGLSFFSPDAVYASPSAQDDEFTDSSLDAKWTSHGNPLKTENAPDSNLLLAGDTGATGINGFLQTIVDGDFKYRAKIYPSFEDNTHYAGTVISVGTSGTHYVLEMRGQSSGQNMDSNVGRWTNRTTFSTSLASPTYSIPNGTPYYLEIDRNQTASTTTFRISFDGIYFKTLHQVTSDSNAYTRIGIHCRGVGGLNRFDWFRKLQGSFTGKLITV